MIGRRGIPLEGINFSLCKPSLRPLLSTPSSAAGSVAVQGGPQRYKRARPRQHKPESPITNHPIESPMFS
jgi:hypothetical protein